MPAQSALAEDDVALRNTNQSQQPEGGVFDTSRGGARTPLKENMRIVEYLFTVDINNIEGCDSEGSLSLTFLFHGTKSYCGM